MSLAPLPYAIPISRRPWWLPTRRQVPFITTIIACILLYIAAGLLYPNFFSLYILISLFRGDQATLGVVAIGTTFVILSGGIDLSVGSVVGCTSIAIAMLIEHAHINPALVMLIVLAGGVLFGALQGCLIHFFGLEPFLVTLGGLFFCRGLALLISTESISITHPWIAWLSFASIHLGHQYIPLSACVLIVVFVICVLVSLFTPFGRNVYALGGSESSSILMGLPIGRTKIAIYALGGFCSALGGILHAVETASGNALTATGMELDAIAAVVVGGTLLTGGVGYVAGTLLGLLIFGMIQVAITLQGNLSSWWSRIAVGVLLLVFILLQKVLQIGQRGKTS